MGSNTLPDRTPGQTLSKTWINAFRTALIGNLIGRKLSGVTEAAFGRLGSSQYPFLQAHIQLGQFGLGDVIPWDDHGGLIDLPQWWMIMDGSTVTEANYDAQHAAGDWDIYVGSSTYGSKTLPNMNGNYLVGKTGALQSGAGTITTVGAHTQNLTHNHTSPRTSTVHTSLGMGATAGTHHYLSSGAHTHSFTIPSALSAAQNIEPEHYLVKFIMRIK